MIIPKTGIRGVNTEKLSVVNVSPEMRERLRLLSSESNATEADIIRHALDKYLPKLRKG